MTSFCHQERAIHVNSCRCYIAASAVETEWKYARLTIARLQHDIVAFCKESCQNLRTREIEDTEAQQMSHGSNSLQAVTWRLAESPRRGSDLRNCCPSLLWTVRHSPRAGKRCFAVLVATTWLLPRLPRRHEYRPWCVHIERMAGASIGNYE